MQSLFNFFASVQKSSLVFFSGNIKKIAGYYFLFCLPMHLPFFFYQTFFRHNHLKPISFFSIKNLIDFATSTIFYCLSNAAVSNLIIILVNLKEEGLPLKLRHTSKMFAEKFLPLLLTTLITNILLFIGFRLFVVPGIYLLPEIALVPTVLIFENRSPIEAIKRSFDVVTGYWGRVFFAIFIYLLFLGGFIMLILHDDHQLSISNLNVYWFFKNCF